jgi:F-type H+-transporting ATPase subunit epsilon
VEAKRRAEEALRDRTSDLNLATAEAELAQAVAQLQAIKKLRNRH